MGAFALPAMAVAIVVLISITTYLTFRDHARERAEERKKAELLGATPRTGLETRRYRSKPKAQR